MKPETIYANIVLFLQLMVNTKTPYVSFKVHVYSLWLTLSFLSKCASSIAQKLYMMSAHGRQHNPVIVTVTKCVLYLKYPD